MYIDIHSHAYWKPAPFVTKFFTPEQLIAAQDKNGIEKGVLLPVVNCEIYLPQTNEDILDMAEKHGKEKLSALFRNFGFSKVIIQDKDTTINNQD